MNDDSDPYMAAARRIAQSDDPRAEVLNLARLETTRRRRKRSIKLAAVAALLLVGVGALSFALRAAPSASEFDTRTAKEDALWMQQLGVKVRQGPLASEDEARVRDFLYSDSGLRRRYAVLVLSGYGLEIDPAILDEIAFELAETIDHPVVVAARGGNHAADALFTNHQATLRAVARAIWYSCARTHSYPRVATIERLLAHPDPELRKTCYKALGHVDGYVLTAEMRARIEADTSDVRRAARKLLEHDKPAEGRD